MSWTFLSELYYLRENLIKPCPIWHKRPIQGSRQGLATINSEIRYLLFTSWYVTEIISKQQPSKQTKSKLKLSTINKATFKMSPYAYCTFCVSDNCIFITLIMYGFNFTWLKVCHFRYKCCSCLILKLAELELYHTIYDLQSTKYTGIKFAMFLIF